MKSRGSDEPGFLFELRFSPLKGKRVRLGMVKRLVGAVNPYVPVEALLVSFAFFVEKTEWDHHAVFGPLSLTDFECLSNWLKTLS